jgi:hypothetical protein
MINSLPKPHARAFPIFTGASPKAVKLAKYRHQVLQSFVARHATRVIVQSMVYRGIKERRVASTIIGESRIHDGRYVYINGKKHQQKLEEARGSSK